MYYSPTCNPLYLVLQVYIIYFIVLLHFVFVHTNPPTRIRARTHSRRRLASPHCPRETSFVNSSSWHTRFLRTFCFYFSFISFFLLRCLPKTWRVYIMRSEDHYIIIIIILHDATMRSTTQLLPQTSAPPADRWWPYGRVGKRREYK